mmetsp:Transcript_1276/g.3841  ORF Transcript_1276/g.3841 Transcript_1276/m.3841 type:complete len:340 (+) Transcript_1276:1269-2288(+)
MGGMGRVRLEAPPLARGGGGAGGAGAVGGFRRRCLVRALTTTGGVTSSLVDMLVAPLLSPAGAGLSGEGALRFRGVRPLKDGGSAVADAIRPPLRPRRRGPLPRPARRCSRAGSSTAAPSAAAAGGADSPAEGSSRRRGGDMGPKPNSGVQESGVGDLGCSSPEARPSASQASAASHTAAGLPTSRSDQQPLSAVTSCNGSGLAGGEAGVWMLAASASASSAAAAAEKVGDDGEAEATRLMRRASVQASRGDVAVGADRGRAGASSAGQGSRMETTLPGALGSTGSEHWRIGMHLGLGGRVAVLSEGESTPRGQLMVRPSEVGHPRAAWCLGTALPLRS